MVEGGDGEHAPFSHAGDHAAVEIETGLVGRALPVWLHTGPRNREPVRT